MTARGSFELSISILASLEDVWRTLVDRARIANWTGGSRVESNWEVGSEITFSGTLSGKPYRDHGTIREFEPLRVLHYDQWHSLSPLADAPGNRSIVELRLDHDGGVTRLSLRHEHPLAATIPEHSAFFWRVALRLIKDLAEGGDTTFAG